MGREPIDYYLALERIVEDLGRVEYKLDRVAEASMVVLGGTIGFVVGSVVALGRNAGWLP